MSSSVPQPGAALTFLLELRATGAPVIRLTGQGSWRGVLPRIEAEAAADPRIGTVLESWHREGAEDLGGPTLAFDEAAARHGAILLFRSAWSYLHRDSQPSEVNQILCAPLPWEPTAAAQFSADLTLQYLPALFRMAQALAPGDPLLPALRHLSAVLPLGSIGFPLQDEVPAGAEPGAWQALRAHPGLWQLFLDRAVRRQDRAWLVHPDVASGLRHSLGAYLTELVPALAPPRHTF
ncbi:MAG: hypothetical protein V4675_06830 [Verrucomicrobiota bacterium]